MHIQKIAMVIVCVCAVCCVSVGAEPIRSMRVDGSRILVNGKTAVLVGDSVTQGWMESGLNFDQNAYLNKLAENGCNAVMLWSYIGITDQIADKRIGYNAPELWPWKSDSGKFDLDIKNPLYFNRLRMFVRDSCEKGIVVILTIHDGWAKSRFPGHPFSVETGGPLADKRQYVDLYDYESEMAYAFNKNWDYRQKNQYYQEKFCKWILDATSAYPNVIYEIMNEGEWYDSKKTDKYEKHFIDFIAKRSKRLIMVNDRPSLKGDPRCDIYSMHNPNWDADTVASDSFKYFNKWLSEPVKPLFFSEPVPEYQGDESMDIGLMRLMWGTVLTGSGFVAQNDCSFGFDSKSAMAEKSMQRDKIISLEGHCAVFMNNLMKFDDMNPNPELASSGVCMAYPGNIYVAYTNQREIKMDISTIKGEAVYSFYDPMKGEFSPWKSCMAGKEIMFDSGVNADRVLVVRKQ